MILGPSRRIIDRTLAILLTAIDAAIAEFEEMRISWRKRIVILRRPPHMSRIPFRFLAEWWLKKGESGS